MNTNLLPILKSSIKRILKESDRVYKIYLTIWTETSTIYKWTPFTLYEDFIECKLIEVTKQQKKDLYAVIVKENDQQRN
jgi:hypothetical protein